MVYSGFRLVAELPATGGVLTSVSFPTVQLLRFVSGADYAVLGCELLFLLQTVWFTCVEVAQLRRERCAYFRSFWNAVDMAIVAIAYTSLAFSAYRYVQLSGTNIQLAAADAGAVDRRHVGLDVLAFGQVQYNTAMACCVFLVWMKVFKYLSFNRTLLQLSTTLSKCAGDLLAFGLMFLIVFVAYAQLGYVLFGTENADFRTYGDALLTLLRTVLGDFDYVAIEKANRVLGPIYFVSYIFFVFFVLLNMFLAIINDAYAEVKADRNAGTIRVRPYLRRQLQRVAGCVVAGGVAGWWRCRRFVTRQKRERNSADDDDGRGESIAMSSGMSEVASVEDVVVRQYDLQTAGGPGSGLPCVPIEGICLQDIFERVSLEAGPADRLNGDLLRYVHGAAGAMKVDSCGWSSDAWSWSSRRWTTWWAN